MSSLQAHLERHDLAVSPLEFRRDCALCRAERVQGQLPSASLVPPRACAAMTAAVLATSAVAPGAAAAADGQGVAAPAPASPPPPQVSDVAVGGGGGAAPVDGDHGAGQEPADAGDQGADSDPRPSERAPETESGSGAVAPSGVGASNPEPTARPDSGDSAGSGDAATVQPAPAAEPAGDSAPAGRPDEPDRPADTPGPAAAPAPLQDEPAAPAPSHAQSDTGRGTLSPGPPASPASGQAVGANHSGGSEEHPASGSEDTLLPRPSVALRRIPAGPLAAIAAERVMRGTGTAAPIGAGARPATARCWSRTQRRAARTGPLVAPSARRPSSPPPTGCARATRSGGSPGVTSARTRRSPQPHRRSPGCGNSTDSASGPGTRT